MWPFVLTRIEPEEPHSICAPTIALTARTAKPWSPHLRMR
jgi:hypothetical protein